MFAYLRILIAIAMASVALAFVQPRLIKHAVIAGTPSRPITIPSFIAAKANAKTAGDCKCAMCKGSGALNCVPCKGTGIDKVNGNVFER